MIISLKKRRHREPKWLPKVTEGISNKGRNGAQESRSQIAVTNKCAALPQRGLFLCEGWGGSPQRLHHAGGGHDVGGMLHKQGNGEGLEGSPGESSAKGGRVFYPHRLLCFRHWRVSLRRDEELENRFVFFCSFSCCPGPQCWASWLLLWKINMVTVLTSRVFVGIKRNNSPEITLRAAWHPLNWTRLHLIITIIITAPCHLTLKKANTHWKVLRNTHRWDQLEGKEVLPWNCGVVLTGSSGPTLPCLS